MSSVLFQDKYGDEVKIHSRYIHYRNRTLENTCIDEIRTKTNRLLLNSYKQNTTSPTLCIHFEDKKKAEEAHRALVAAWFDTSEKDDMTSWFYWRASCCRRPHPRPSLQDGSHKEE